MESNPVILAQGLGDEALLPIAANGLAIGLSLLGLICGLRKAPAWAFISSSVIGIVMGFLAVLLFVKINWLGTLSTACNFRSIVDHLARHPVAVMVMLLPFLLGALAIGLGLAKRS